MNTSDPNTMAQAIIALHATSLALAETQPNAVVFTNDKPVYRAVKAACRSMG